MPPAAGAEPAAEPSPAISRALESIRPDGSAERRLEVGEVTAVLDLAFERLRVAQEESGTRLRLATRRLTHEARATRALSQEIQLPVPPLPKKQ